MDVRYDSLYRSDMACMFIEFMPILGWANFEGWNMLEFLPDQFKAPGPKHLPFANGSSPIDPDTDPRAQYMIPRCWLEIDTIIKRMTDLKLEYANELRLTKVYISTNGLPEWVDKLKNALLNSGWTSVISTHDLKLTWEESGVDSAIGTSVCRPQSVYSDFSSTTFPEQIWSSRQEGRYSLGMASHHLPPLCTSLNLLLPVHYRIFNIRSFFSVSLRLARGVPAKHIRFW